jgi:hypothetical protein
MPPDYFTDHAFKNEFGLWLKHLGRARLEFEFGAIQARRQPIVPVVPALICRSLLASDSGHPMPNHTLNRLPVPQAQGPEPVEGQASSYISTRLKRASGYRTHRE